MLLKRAIAIRIWSPGHAFGLKISDRFQVIGVMEDERMPKLNLTRDGPKLTVSDLHLMKQVEAANLARATRLRKARFGNRIFGSLLATLAASIYAYSMYAVKQEKFLDDFDEPEKISDQQ